MTPTNDWQTELDEINEPLDFFEALKTISDIKESLALHLLDVLRSYEFPEDPEELHQDICMFNALCGVLGGFVPALKDVKKQLSKCLTIFENNKKGDDQCAATKARRVLKKMQDIS